MKARDWLCGSMEMSLFPSTRLESVALNGLVLVAFHEERWHEEAGNAFVGSGCLARKIGRA